MPSSACQTCALDRKSTRLNSSHTLISYAVFCLKKSQKAERAVEGETPLDRGVPDGRTRTAAMCSRAPVDAVAERPRQFFPECVAVLFFLKEGAPPDIPPPPPRRPPP